jgi:hypothetical protein
MQLLSWLLIAGIFSSNGLAPMLYMRGKFSDDDVLEIIGLACADWFGCRRRERNSRRGVNVAGHIRRG